MVGVVETKAASCALKLFGGNALQGGLSSHGHEDGEVDGSMRKSQDGSASPCCLCSPYVLTLVTDIHCGDPTYTAGGLDIQPYGDFHMNPRLRVPEQEIRTPTYRALSDQLKSERRRGSLV